MGGKVGGQVKEDILGDHFPDLIQFEVALAVFGPHQIGEFEGRSAAAHFVDQAAAELGHVFGAVVGEVAQLHHGGVAIGQDAIANADAGKGCGHGHDGSYRGTAFRLQPFAHAVAHVD